MALPPCPSSPNCVSSQADDALHRVEPLRFVGEPTGALAELRRIIEATPGARVVAGGERTLEAEYRSRVFGFVDDLMLELDPDAKLVHVRSASRLGYHDLGANRRRVEALRSAFRSGSGELPDDDEGL